jgi:hypothetical protein
MLYFPWFYSFSPRVVIFEGSFFLPFFCARQMFLLSIGGEDPCPIILRGFHLYFTDPLRNFDLSFLCADKYAFLNSNGLSPATLCGCPAFIFLGFALFAVS